MPNLREKKRRLSNAGPKLARLGYLRHQVMHRRFHQSQDVLKMRIRGREQSDNLDGHTGSFVRKNLRDDERLGISRVAFDDIADAGVCECGQIYTLSFAFLV